MEGNLNINIKDRELCRRVRELAKEEGRSSTNMVRRILELHFRAMDLADKMS